jgi:hypothetical protein
MSISCIEHAETELRPLRNIVHTSVEKLGQGLVAPLAEFWGKLDSESRRISQNLSESLESFGILEILNPRRPTPKFSVANPRISSLEVAVVSFWPNYYRVVCQRLLHHHPQGHKS